MLKKLVSIWGASHCGSTLLEMILGSLPGCATTGESYTYVRSDVIENFDGRMIMDDPRQPICTSHPHGCEALTPDFVVRLRRDNLYEQLAERLGVETLITSDKNPWTYAELLNAKPRPIVAVVLFKNPLEYARSMVRERKALQQDDSVEAVLTAYCQVYNAIIREIEQRSISAIYEEYRDLAFEPDRRVRAICEHCGLEYDPACLRYWEKEHHRVGGNYGRVHREHEIKMDDSWRSALSHDQRAEVAQNKDAWLVYAGLCARKARE